MKGLLVAILSLPLLGGPVTIRLSKSVMLAGDTVTIVCLVEVSEENESLTIALGSAGGFETSSSKSLNGEMGGGYHDLIIPKGKLGCGDYVAQCALTRKVNLQFETSRDSAPLTVRGGNCGE